MTGTDALRVAVVGAGAIGTVFARIYREAGLSVILVEKEHARATCVRAGRFTIAMPGGGRHVLQVPVHTYPLPDLGPLDLVQVSVKGFDTARAAEDVRQLVSPGTLVLSVQNGLGNLEILADVYGPDRIVGGITAHSAQVIGEDEVRYGGGHGPLLAMGPWSSTPHPRVFRVLERFADRLARAGYQAQIVEDVAPVLWLKLVANTASNAVAALTGRTAAEMLASAPVCDLVRSLAAESAAVARARGISIPELDDPWEYVRQGLEGVGRNKISMLQDLESGRPTEIGTLNEAICLEAQRLGVAAPGNRVVSLLVRALEEQREEGRSGRPPVVGK